MRSLIDYAVRNSDRVEGLYASPAYPEVQQRLRAVWMELERRCDLDGIPVRTSTRVQRTVELVARARTAGASGVVVFAYGQAAEPGARRGTAAAAFR